MKGFIKVRPDKKNFIESESGEKFIPFGLNYIDPHCWEQNTEPHPWRGPHPWLNFNPQRIEKDFERMSNIGINIVRISITANSFIIQDKKQLESNLKKLDYVIKIAKDYGIRLILSNFLEWEGYSENWTCNEDKITQYYDSIPQKKLVNLCKLLGERYCDEPTIFSYSLQNEAMIPWNIPVELWIKWLKIKYKNNLVELKSSWNDYNIIDWTNITIPPDIDNRDNNKLYDYQLFREWLSYKWLREQVSAIRSVDKNHMISLGNIQWNTPLYRKWEPIPSGYVGFDPHVIGPLLDYISIHWYPCKPDFIKTFREFIPKALVYMEETLKYNSIGKPLVVEEFGAGSSVDNPETEKDHSNWLKSVIDMSKNIVSGWLVWMYADPENAEQDMGIFTSNYELKEAGKTWQEIGATIKNNKLKKTVSVKNKYIWEIDKKTLLTWYGGTVSECKKYSDTGGFWTEEYVRLKNEGKDIEFKLVDVDENFFEMMTEQWNRV